MALGGYLRFKWIHEWAKTTHGVIKLCNRNQWCFGRALPFFIYQEQIGEAQVFLNVSTKNPGKKTNELVASSIYSTWRNFGVLGLINSFYKWIINHSKPAANITMEKKVSMKVACGCFIIFGAESRRNDRPSHETCSQRAVLRMAVEGPRKFWYRWLLEKPLEKPCSGNVGT